MNSHPTLSNDQVTLPIGFHAFVTNLGIRDNSDDCVVIAADRPVPTAGMFTQSRFAGPSVTISRSHLADGYAQAMVVISKNANVATGEIGTRDATELADLVAERLVADPDDIVVASTGVIGRTYPMDRIRRGLATMPAVLTGRHAIPAARAMMTTDTVPKVAESSIEGTDARVVGIAKGVGMIEPDMATMIAVVLTDAEVEPDDLAHAWHDAVETTFNSVSIDTDTSTSDTAVVMASGAAGPVPLDALTMALTAVSQELAIMIARDGEGAETLIEVHVDGARDDAQAKLVAKSIVNSPLVKTAVHGADPNWGRVAMAIGKCSDQTDIDPDRVIIRFGTTEVYPQLLDDTELAQLSDYMATDTVVIHVSLEIGDGEARVWGCDLTDGYVRINADYTT